VKRRDCDSAVVVTGSEIVVVANCVDVSVRLSCTVVQLRWNQPEVLIDNFTTITLPNEMKVSFSMD
jgi:hypothetical protein